MKCSSISQLSEQYENLQAEESHSEEIIDHKKAKNDNNVSRKIDNNVKLKKERIVVKEKKSNVDSK
jgi:hypothetical protein